MPYYDPGYLIYKICRLCGAHLDPNEKCDCKQTTKIQEEKEDGKDSNVRK